MTKTQIQVQVQKRPRKRDEQGPPPVTRKILRTWFSHDENGDKR
jgi:hypothetical protein